jgi:septum formation protein
MHQLILASASPRRKEILEKAGYKITVLPVKVSEIPKKYLNPAQQVLDIARQKSEAWLLEHKSLITNSILLVSCDTEVILNGELTGKPKDKSQARQFLDQLSGKTHEVVSALHLIMLPEMRELSHIETTQITFHELSEREKIDYINSDEPYDKAGGYGIQGDARKFVSKIDGDFLNVVGFPIEAFKKMLEQNKIQVEG